MKIAPDLNEPNSEVHSHFLRMKHSLLRAAASCRTVRRAVSAAWFFAASLPEAAPAQKPSMPRCA